MIPADTKPRVYSGRSATASDLDDVLVAVGGFVGEKSAGVRVAGEDSEV